MNNIKYIGMDVHSASISVAVRDAAGKLIMEARIQTQAAAILGLIQGLKGPVQAALEEGTHAEWLHDLLSPHVAKLVVCDARQMPRHKREKKNDRLDARKLAELLWLGNLKGVYHGNASLRALRELTRSYLTLVRDTTQVMNRLKAIYRGRGIAGAGTRVYSPRFREAWLAQLRERGVRARAELLYQQLDLLLLLRHEAKKRMLAESRKQRAQEILLSIPSLGPVRVAVLMALMQTPYRFRTKRQLWTYAGLSLVTRSSADYRVIGGQLTRSPKPVLILGLNANHNHGLKAIFKDAAVTALARCQPFREFYTRWVAQGMKPELARVTLARKIASVTLTLWKKGERFNAEHLKAQAA
ncbi:MAG: IS110 family transposase [Terriglobia bacterium]